MNEVYTMYADGWYSDRQMVKLAIANVRRSPYVKVIGIVESEHRTWAVLYWSMICLYENHIIDQNDSIFAIGNLSS